MKKRKKNGKNEKRKNFVNKEKNDNVIIYMLLLLYVPNASKISFSLLNSISD